MGVKYKVTIAYDGTDFHGWQKQEPPDSEPLRTVQGELEKAALDVARAQIMTLGASRTDAGVHAKGQVAIISTTRDIEPERMLFALNSRLPNDIKVTAVEFAPFSFDPINGCTSKGYRYQLIHGCCDPRNKPLFDRRVYAIVMPGLNTKAMMEAAPHFVGEHDFVGFTKMNHGRESTVRRVDACYVSILSDHRIAIDIAGKGFLWNMIRIIAGTLVDVGLERTQPSEIPEIIQSGDRTRAGKTMPPEGLCLEWIKYD